MIQQIETYMLVFAIIVIVGHVFNKSIVPISLILVLTGMILSFIPEFPSVTLNPEVVLDIFLPILVYQISFSSSWRDTKKNIRPIALLSIGHVIFITVLIAWVIHALIPSLGWPLAFVLGAVISPPDDVAIVSIAEKIRLPERVLTILQGEGLLNDATALILFRVALVATVTHQFVMADAVIHFFYLVIGETLYGLFLGHFMGELRVRLSNTKLHMMASLLTPFLAYLPPVLLGGSGIVATVVTGYIIGNKYSLRFTPEFRLISLAMWPMLAFGIDCLIFLLVGLDMRSILESISSISFASLVIYSSAVILTLIIGRFIWVYGALVTLPRVLMPSINKKDPYPPWQYPFIISWSGMRGGISLAAALAVPVLPNVVEGANPRDLLIFLVFVVIAVTFVAQGLTLPWIIKVIGIKERGLEEEYNEHISELRARKAMAASALQWLKQYKNHTSKEDQKLLDQINIFLKEYKMINAHLKDRIADHHGETSLDNHDENAEAEGVNALKSQLIEIERASLMDIWRKGKISFAVRNKLLDKLDHRVKHLPS